MFAPSDTAIQPFASSVFASSPFSSFWVALGKAVVHFSPQGRDPSTYLQLIPNLLIPTNPKSSHFYRYSTTFQLDSFISWMWKYIQKKEADSL